MGVFALIFRQLRVNPNPLALTHKSGNLYSWIRAHNTFLSCCVPFLKETTPPKSQGVEWEKIYKLARIHFVIGAVYVAIQKLNIENQPEEHILKKFKTAFFATCIRYEKQKKMSGEITEKLAEEKIKHIFFKGSIVKEYYPVKEMRTLGDIDLLLHKQNQEAAKKAFVEIGYKNISSSKTRNFWVYEKNNLTIDVHDTLMYGEINKKADYIYFYYFESLGKCGPHR